jgi:hypothetical protein
MVESLVEAHWLPERRKPRRIWLAAVAIAILAFALYLSNGQTLASFDSAPNSLLVFNVLTFRRLDFDAFRSSYFAALGGQYAFVEAPNGQLTSVFPIGTAIVTAPYYLLLAATHALAHVAPITSAAFEPIRQLDEKRVAALVAALSAALLFLCACELGAFAPALVVTAVYALATPTWSISSQALWQHGPVNLVVLGSIYALARADRGNGSRPRALWVTVAGVGAGLLPVIRPTAALFSLALLGFTVWNHRRGSWPFVVGALLGCAPGIAWNDYFFHTVIGGYAADQKAYDFNLARASAALAGLLVSPSRGLLTFSPLLALAVLGAFRLRRSTARLAPLIAWLGVACLVLIVQYAFYRTWWAGFAYGPRFLTDTVGVAALLVLFALPANLRQLYRGTIASRFAAGAFSLAFVYSVAVQFVGVNSGAAGSEWNSVPISVDREPQRLWQLSDSQIERNARAAWYRFFGSSFAGSSRERAGLALRVVSVTPPSRLTAGSKANFSALVENDGPSEAFGYTSGIYIGQLRVRVRLTGPHAPMNSEQLLYVGDSLSRGQRGAAIGMLAVPRIANTYMLELTPTIVGESPLRQSRTMRWPLTVY